MPGSREAKEVEYKSQQTLEPKVVRKYNTGFDEVMNLGIPDAKNEGPSAGINVGLKNEQGVSYSADYGEKDETVAYDLVLPETSVERDSLTSKETKSGENSEKEGAKDKIKQDEEKRNEDVKKGESDNTAYSNDDKANEHPEKGETFNAINSSIGSNKNNESDESEEKQPEQTNQKQVGEADFAVSSPIVMILGKDPQTEVDQLLEAHIVQGEEAMKYHGQDYGNPSMYFTSRPRGASRPYGGNFDESENIRKREAAMRSRMERGAGSYDDIEYETPSTSRFLRNRTTRGKVIRRPSDSNKTAKKPSVQKSRPEKRKKPLPRKKAAPSKVIASKSIKSTLNRLKRSGKTVKLKRRRPERRR